ncbi:MULTISPECIES: TetR/AcrR family transcriptional regulator [unclassified Aeromicrobium]|jgi:AcrR family transcriptional regulator|uniref:TetR/AcrR family transcriptional regulator n=1 Tax=unclassified Aeromicrobium TaxID=2633570 RepID=UPI002580609F|nr:MULTISPECIES: TetR/AcrR family transcriptional regulator [unclassified Aeromicrobium]
MDESSLHERLLESAVATVAELGWRDAAVEPLCARAGTTPAAFYAEFATLDDLFVALYRREARDRVAAIDRSLRRLVSRRRRQAGAGAPVEPASAVAAVADAVGAELSDRRWWLVSTEYMLRAVRHPDVGGEYLRVRREVHEQVVDVVGRAVADLGLVLQVEVDRLVELGIVLHRGVVGQSLLDPVATSATDLDRLVWEALVVPAAAADGPRPTWAQRVGVEVANASTNARS